MSHSLRREAALKQSLHCFTIIILQILILHSHGYLPSIKNTLTPFFFFFTQLYNKDDQDCGATIFHRGSQDQQQNDGQWHQKKLTCRPCFRPHYWCLWFGRGPHHTDLSHSGHIDLPIAAVTNYIDDCCISFRCAAARAPALCVLAHWHVDVKKGTRPSFTSLCAPLLLFLQDESADT